MPVGGVPVVNRLSNLSSKFFMSGLGPNFTDHDCRTGAMIEPNGYQILTSKLESECEVLSASAEAEAGLDSDVNGTEEYLLREMNDAVTRNGAVDPGDPNQVSDTSPSLPGASPPLHTNAGHSYSMDTSHFPSVQSADRFSLGNTVTDQEACSSNSSAERFSPGNTNNTREACSSNSISSVRLGRLSSEHSSQFVSVEIAAQENNNNTQIVQEADLSLNHGFHLTEVDRRIDDRNRTLADIAKRMETQKKFILLMVVDSDRELLFKVKRTTLMKKLKKCYSERVGVPTTMFKFVFNGRRINHDDTAHALEMNPGAIINVYPEQSSKKLASLKEDWTSDEDTSNQPSPTPRSLIQTDGNGEISSDSNSSDDFDYEFRVAPKRRKICDRDFEESSSSQNSVSSPSDNSCSSNEDCSDTEVTRPDVNSNEVSIEESFVEKGSLEEFLDNLPSAKVSEDELGRPHIKCPTSGPAFIFFKSCRTKGATISRHCNDLLTIAEVSFSLPLFLKFRSFHSGP